MANGNGEASDADVRLTEKVMTTIQTVSASIDADRAKKLAHNLKKRFAELGIEICLNHGYEAVAALHGQPNWATMKAVLGKSPGGEPMRVPTNPVRVPLAPQFVLSLHDEGSARVTLSPLACLDHFHVAGFEGDDKSAVLLGMAESSLEQGAGFMLCDSSGEAAIVERVMRLARLYGREKDVSVLDLTGRGRGTNSISIDIFRFLKPAELAAVVVDLMSADIAGDAKWRSRAVTCAAGAWEALLWMHDHKGESISYSALDDYLSYNRLRELSYGGHPEDLPAEIRSKIKSYLNSLPGMMRMKHPAADPTPAVLEEHGKIRTDLTDVLNRLNCDYGQVLSHRGSADLFDHVVDGGKIFVVLLPPVEHRGDPESLAGTFIHSSFAKWLSRRAGKGIARSRRGRQPFLAIFDEVDGYEVRDRNVMAEDARNSGISLVFADFPNTRHPKPNPLGGTLIHAREGTMATIHGDITYTSQKMRVFR